MLDEIRARDKAIPETEECWCDYHFIRFDNLCGVCGHLSSFHDRPDHCTFQKPRRLSQAERDRRNLLEWIDTNK